MSGKVGLVNESHADRFERASAKRPPAHKDLPTHPYNIALVCGNMVQIFTPERFHELPKEVERLLSWGNELHEIDLQLLESDDPFQ